MEKLIINKKSIYLSSLMGTSNSKSIAIFKCKVPSTDNYVINPLNNEKVSIYNLHFKILGLFTNRQEISLKKDSTVYVFIETNVKNVDFYVEIYPLNSLSTPYPIKDIYKNTNFDSYNCINKDNPAKVVTSKRKGGTYLYNNCPESMPDEAINSIIMTNSNLKGDCFLTFEVQNKSSHPYVYLGYRLINKEDHDIYVTIRNIGYQVDGSWLGEKSWMDYYGVKYDMGKVKSLPDIKAKWFHDYLGFDINYIPSPIKPITYRIPKHKSLFILGGTSKDNYKNINVANSADKKVYIGHCVNANMFFTISEGKALGQMVAYDNIKKINSKNAIIQNYRSYGKNDDMGGRIGKSNHHGVIDMNIVWKVDDNTPKGKQYVTYDNYYADTLKDNYKPFEKVTGISKHTYINQCWNTHLSCQLSHEFVGLDMVDNTTYYKGKKVVLSNYIANGLGQIFDFGNWMIEYQENHTFINKSNKDKKINLYMCNGGSLFYIVKDKDGNIIKSSITMQECSGIEPCYSFTLKANSKQFISFQYVLPANNCGNVKHYLIIE